MMAPPVVHPLISLVEDTSCHDQVCAEALANWPHPLDSIQDARSGWNLAEMAARTSCPRRETLQTLLAHGVTLSPQVVAKLLSCSGHGRIAELLDVLGPGVDLEVPVCTGYTALQLLIRYGTSAQAVTALLAAGARHDVLTPDNEDLYALVERSPATHAMRVCMRAAVDVAFA